MSGRIPSSLLDAQAALRSGDLPGVALAEWALHRAQQTAPLRAFLRIDGEDTLRAAHAAARRWQDWQAQPALPPPGALNGIPLAHKDLFYRPAGAPGCGARAPAPAQPDVEASVLLRLREANALDLGPLHLSEFAYGPTGHNVHLGPCRNPWNADHVTGGSSSGSAVAVATGAVYASLGSDSGGSVRTPASWCGVAGLKPSRGAISLAGVMPLAYSMDTVGILARDCRDLAVLFALLTGPDPRDARTARTAAWDGDRYAAAREAPIRLGVLESWFHEDLSDSIALGLDTARHQWSTALEARIVSVRVPGLDQIARRARVLMLAEAWQTHQPLIERHDALYSPGVLARLLAGSELDPAAVADARQALAPSQRDFVDHAFRDAEVLLLPCNPTVAPRIEDTSVNAGPDMLRLIDGITRCLRPFNYLGLPAITLPAGRDAAGLPFGIQLVGRPGSEATLLALGARWQQVTEWHLHRPPGFALD